MFSLFNFGNNGRSTPLLGRRSPASVSPETIVSSELFSYGVLLKDSEHGWHVNMGDRTLYPDGAYYYLHTTEEIRVTSCFDLEENKIRDQAVIFEHLAMNAEKILCAGVINFELDGDEVFVIKIVSWSDSPAYSLAKDSKVGLPENLYESYPYACPPRLGSL